MSMLLAGAAVLALAIGKPVEMPASPVVVTKFISPSQAAATTAPAESSAGFASLLDVVLRRPLVDPKPTTAPSANNLTLGLRVVGTIIEPSHSYAIFTDGSGNSLIKSVGDRAGGVPILAINPDAVTLQINGRSVVLHTLKPSLVGGSGL